MIEPALLDSELALALPSKEGALDISPAKRKRGRPVCSRNKTMEGGSSKVGTPSGGKRRVPKPLSAARKLQLQLVVAGDGEAD